MWFAATSKLPTVSPVMFNFMPSWWHRRHSISYGERMFWDPDYRVSSLREMQRLMYECFSDIGLGEQDPLLVPCLGELANATIPAALGCEVGFAIDKYPCNTKLNEADLLEMEVPADIRDVFPMREIISQAAYLSRKYKCELKPSWPLMGIQNIAVQVRGSDFFMDYYTRPELTEMLLKVSEQTMSKSIDYFASVDFRPEVLWNQNCTVVMVGPKTYAEHLLAPEQSLWAKVTSCGMGYGLHHCGCLDEYSSVYRQVKRIAQLEIGWKSDLRSALDIFPESQIFQIIDFAFIKDSTPQMIRDHMRSLVCQAGADICRVGFNVSDLEYGTPDENIRAVVEGLMATT